MRKRSVGSGNAHLKTTLDISTEIESSFYELIIYEIGIFYDLLFQFNHSHIRVIAASVPRLMEMLILEPLKK